MLWQSRLFVVVFLALCCSDTWCLCVQEGQQEEQLVTGDDAQNQFVYQGKPIHPLCIEFPLEGSSRSKPMDLAGCTQTTIIPSRNNKGWFTAEDRESEGVPAGFASYRVLAEKKSKFLVATTVSGGGSGVFESLMWLQLSEDRLTIVKEEQGGDRCGGGIADEYALDGALLRFSRSVTPADIVELSGIKADTVQEGLEQTPASCFGLAYYEYDLKNEVSKLLSVHLHAGFYYPNKSDGKAESEWTQNTDGPRYQSCFNRLFNAYIDDGKSKLDTVELKEFGQKFTHSCVAQK